MIGVLRPARAAGARLGVAGLVDRLALRQEHRAIELRQLAPHEVLVDLDEPGVLLVGVEDDGQRLLLAEEPQRLHPVGPGDQGVQPIAAVGPDMDGRLLADLADGRGDMRSVD